jgi:hypothetical protein
LMKKTKEKAALLMVAQPTAIDADNVDHVHRCMKL